ncbi:MAG TPA: hypothetical protein VGA56_20090, partial [Opitutaceae bacterium]
LELLELAGAQVPDGVAQLYLALPKPMTCAIEVTSRIVRCACGQLQRSFELQSDPGESLLEGVVEIAGKAGALRDDPSELKLPAAALRAHVDREL